jgi:hypothetical protein
MNQLIDGEAAGGGLYQGPQQDRFGFEGMANREGAP